MASAFAVFALLGISSVCTQAIGSERGGVLKPYEHHKHLDGCLLPNSEDLMPFNETRSLPERCLQVTCLPDRTIGYQHCEPVLVPQECSQTDYNNTLPYPKCCPVMICENSNSTIIQNDRDSTANITTDNPSNNTTLLIDTASNSTTLSINTPSNNTNFNSLEGVTHIQKIRAVKRNTNYIPNQTTIKTNEPQNEKDRQNDRDSTANITTDNASNSTTLLLDTASNSTTLSINTPSNNTTLNSLEGVTHIQKIRAVKINTNNIPNQTTIKSNEPQNETVVKYQYSAQKLYTTTEKN